jgi:hypothetical protein
VEIEVVKRTQTRIEAIKIEETCLTSLLWKAKSLFIDCKFTWPLHYSFYYLGHIPPLDSHVPLDKFKSQIQRDRFIHNLKSDWHMSSIRLASQIFGWLQKEMARRWDTREDKSRWGKEDTLQLLIRVHQGMLALSWVVSGKGGYHHVNNVNKDSRTVNNIIKANVICKMRWWHPRVDTSGMPQSVGQDFG